MRREGAPPHLTTRTASAGRCRRPAAAARARRAARRSLQTSCPTLCPFEIYASTINDDSSCAEHARERLREEFFSLHQNTTASLVRGMELAPHSDKSTNCANRDYQASTGRPRGS